MFFLFLVVFLLGSSFQYLIVPFAISTSFCIQSGPEVGIVIFFFKNLSRSLATGKLQATLNGTFFGGNPYFEQESGHRQITGNPETDF